MKVYLRADENEAGVTVEDYGKNPHAAILIRRSHCRCDQYSESEARAVVEGLLRRMLEREGWDSTVALVIKACGRKPETGR